MDPDARHTRKSPEARRDGYRAHLAADPETGIITDEKLTRAAGTENSDPAVAGEFLAAETAGHGTAARAPPRRPRKPRTAARPPVTAARVRVRVTGLPGTATPHTAPVTCGMR